MQTKTIHKEPVKVSIKPFIIRGLALVIGWNIVYHIVLVPAGIPDSQLTAAVQWGTSKMLGPFFANITQSGASIFINGRQSINIAPQCNGLELIVLYIGFILCIPAGICRMAIFSLAGIVIIYILNVFRCSLLAWMYYDHHSLANFAHHYAFKMIIYAAVFYGWVLYAKKSETHAK